MLPFSNCLILLNFQRHVHSIFVWNMIKQSESRWSAKKILTPSLKAAQKQLYIYNDIYIHIHE